MCNGKKNEILTLINWHLLVNFAKNEKFDYFQLKVYFFHPGFSTKTLIMHL